MLSARLQEGEVFTKTSCYHYFHCHCLGRYVRHSESELRQREKELEEDKTRDRTRDQVRYQQYKEGRSLKSLDVGLYRLRLVGADRGVSGVSRASDVRCRSASVLPRPPAT